MRILAIRGSNLASLAGEFEIDLTRGALAEAGVFAIVGNTGAGKSTLLDALCVALFDRTPRLTNHSRVVVGRGADDPGALGAQDARTLLRRGAASGWAEVDFESGDLRRYRARWAVRRARNQTDGTLQDQQISLVALDGAVERLGGTKTETLKAISSRLGLTFDQFRRSALLAQGDFAAFLRADGRDRSELLERMTGTQVYTRLSIAAHVRAALAEQRLRDGRAAALAIPVLDDDARATAEHALAAHREARAAARTRLAGAEAAARWVAEAEQRGRALGRAEAELALAEAAVTATAAERSELALGRRAEVLRAPWEHATHLERQLAVVRDEGAAATAAAALAGELASTIATRRGDIAALLDPIRAARVAARAVERAPDPVDVARVMAQAKAVGLGDAAWLVARPGLAPEVAAWPEVDARYAEHASVTEATLGLDRELSGYAAQKAALSSSRETIVVEHRAAIGRLAEAQRRAAAQQQKRGLTLDAARRKEDGAREHLAEVERLVAIASAARQAVTARMELDLQLRELEAAGRTDLEQRAALEARLGTDVTIRAERTRVLDELRRAAGYEHARAELREGEPCPLCGSPEHPWHDRGSFDGVIREAEQRLREIGEQLDATTASLAASTARAQHRLREHARLDRHRATVVATSESTQASWREQLAALGELVLVEDPSTTAAEALATEREADARSRLEAARTARAGAETAAKAAAEAQAEVQIAQTAVTELHERLAELDRRAADLVAAGGRVRGERAGRIERLAELTAHLDAAVARWVAALPAPPSPSSKVPADDRALLVAEAHLRSLAAARHPAPHPRTVPLDDAPATAATSAKPRAVRRKRGGERDSTGGEVQVEAQPSAHVVASEEAHPVEQLAEGSGPSTGLADGSGPVSPAAAVPHERVAEGSAGPSSTEPAYRLEAKRGTPGVAREPGDRVDAMRGTQGVAREPGDRVDAMRGTPGVAREPGDRVDAMRSPWGDAEPSAPERSDGPALAAEVAQRSRACEAMRAIARAHGERGGRVAEVEAGLVAALASVDAEARDVERAAAEHAARRDDRVRRRDELAAELADATNRLEGARVEAGIDRDDLRRLLAREPARIEALAARLAGVDRGREASLAVVRERTRLLVEHDGARPTTFDALGAVATDAARAAPRLVATAVTAPAAPRLVATAVTSPALPAPRLAATAAAARVPSTSRTHLAIVREPATDVLERQLAAGDSERWVATWAKVHALAAAAVEELGEAAATADELVAQLVATLAADADARVRRAAALERVAGDESDAALDRILGEVIGSHDGKLFRSFAQSLTLDGLLAVANAHLDELAPRYQLERVPRHDLELQVIDRDLGSEVRSVQSLSGGESFLVSLALALGLSSMSAHDVRVRTLLIDEGFGTLDPATLDGALSVLDALQATGRQVGVISHVPALVERVGAHVRVVQRGGGRSEVIVGG